ncbi:formyltransferase family protein [Taibaiella helva]|uniref:formyltransferase family protein n=1 Tax=Taibaiella helva TaxID=2301235 RepID=UPI000E598169|nr:formyltransferase family protein [Taibaiella helva]
MAVRIVFLGSKPIGYQCLQYLLEKKDALDVALVGVRTRMRKEFGAEGNDLAALAAQHGIPLLQSLDELPECDIIYSVQHHELLQAAHIRKARRIAVNLHLAPLPEYRGCNQFSFAIMDEATEFGVTLHEIDTRIDHGDVLFEQRFSIPENCWVNELYELTFSAGMSLFRDSLKPLLDGSYARTPQSELMKHRPSSLHFREEIGALKQIDLTRGEKQVQKAIRATYMPGFEPPYTLIGGKKVYFSLENEPHAGN